jgi:PilZ domain
MAEEQATNRRQHERHAVSFPVDFLGGAIGSGQASDLSVLGCAVGSELPVPLKAYLKLQLDLPDGDSPLEIELAVVRWSFGGSFGVEFIAFGEAQKSRLKRFLIQIATQSQKP